MKLFLTGKNAQKCDTTSVIMSCYAEWSAKNIKVASYKRFVFVFVLQHESIKFRKKYIT